MSNSNVREIIGNEEHETINENMVVKRRKNSTSSKKKRTKVSDDDFAIPSINDSELILTNNYRVSQLRQICKHYEQKRAGNKDQLEDRVYNYLKYSCCARKIQTVWRTRMVREWFACKGITITPKPKCTNETDFLTMEPIQEMPISRVFMFKDTDGFQYGFDTTSLYNLVLKNGNKVENPYTRQSMPKTVARRLRRVIRLNKILGYPIDVSLHEEDGLKNMSPRRRLEMRTIDLCQRIDALGNHTNIEWFLSLNTADYQQVLRELWDIWHYRASLSHQTRQEVCPPDGNPFASINLTTMGTLSEHGLWKAALGVFEKMIGTGINQESRALGAIYVLTALTLVSMDAAQCLPWLYQSVAHVQ